MADDDNPFESPRLLLVGAARHIEAFEAALADLRQAGDWAFPELQPDGSILIKNKPGFAVPPAMKQIVFDLTNNLRSALDHAVFASTLALTGEERDKTKFPIGDTAKDARDDANRRCKGVPRDILDFLLAFEVHRDGNAIVWALNKLRNTKSHRVLVPFATSVDLVGVGEPSPGTSASHEWDQAAGRFKLRMQPPPDGFGGVMFTFRLDLQIGTGKFRGEPALALFNSMLSEVEGIVSAIEAETARLLRVSRR